MRVLYNDAVTRNVNVMEVDSIESTSDLAVDACLWSGDMVDMISKDVGDVSGLVLLSPAYYPTSDYECVTLIAFMLRAEADLAVETAFKTGCLDLRSKVVVVDPDPDQFIDAVKCSSDLSAIQSF